MPHSRLHWCRLLVLAFALFGNAGRAAPPPAEARATGEFSVELACIRQVVQLAQEGDIAGAGRLLCEGGDPERVGWRAVSATGMLRENNCHLAAEQLTQWLLARAEAQPATMAEGWQRGRAYYWRSRLAATLPDQAAEAQRALRAAEADNPDDPDVRRFRTQQEAIATAQSDAQQGGRP